MVTVTGDALTLSGLLKWLRLRGGEWVREMDEDKGALRGKSGCCGADKGVERE